METKKIYHVLDQSFDSKSTAELGLNDETVIYDRKNDIMYRYVSPENKDVTFGEWKVNLSKFSFGKNITTSRRMSNLIEKYGLFEENDTVTPSVSATKFIPATNIVWHKKVNDTRYDQGNDIHVDPNGDVYIVGTRKSNDAGWGKYGIVKLSGVDGKTAWQKSISSVGQDHGNAVVIDVSSNVIVAETQKTMNQGHGVVKIDPIGNVLWQRTYGDGNTSNCGVTSDTAGNIYLVGIKPNKLNTDDSYDLSVIKLEPGGEIIWQKVLGGAVIDHNNSIGVDPDGNVYVAGSQGVDSISGKTGFIIIKLTQEGELDWQHKVGTSYSYGQAGACKIVVDDNNVYLAGTYQKGASKSGIIKINTKGAVIWKKVVGSYIDPLSLCIDGSGNLYFNGKPSLSTGASNDFYVTKMTTAGDVLWTKLIGGAKQDEGSEISVDSAGHVFVNSKHLSFKQRKLQNDCDISIIKLHKDQPTDYTVIPTYDNTFRTYNIGVDVSDSEITGVNMNLLVSNMNLSIGDII